MGALALLFSGLVWCVLCVMEYREHGQWWAARRKTQQYFKENVFVPGIVYVILLPIFGAVYWPYTIYSREHKAVADVAGSNKGLIDENKTLTAANQALTASVYRKAHYFDRSDALFSNTVYLIGAFKSFGERTRVPTGNDCSIRITAPEETADFAETIHQLWRNVVNCGGDGPFLTGVDPDRDKETLDGMIPDKIILHAVRGDGAADGLFNDLRRYLPLQRIFYGTEADIPHHKVWLQFGSKVDWVVKEFKQ